jgi:hypothetical protein
MRWSVSSSGSSPAEEKQELFLFLATRLRAQAAENCRQGANSALAKSKRGSEGVGGGTAVNSPLQQEVGDSAFKAYNHGVALMHEGQFAARLRPEFFMGSLQLRISASNYRSRLAQPEC